MGLRYNNPASTERRELSRFGKLAVVAGCIMGVAIIIIIILSTAKANKAKEIVDSYRAVCKAAVSTCRTVAGNDKNLLDIIKRHEKNLEKAKTIDKLNNLTIEMLTEVSASVQSGKADNKQYLLDEIVGAMNEVNYAYSELSKMKR